MVASAIVAQKVIARTGFLVGLTPALPREIHIWDWKRKTEA